MRSSDFFDFDRSSNLERGPSLAQQAYRNLKIKFLLGEMHPGTRMTYRQVATELGISVTPAREAILKLLAEHVFEPGSSGTVEVPKLSAEACRELWRIRILLEGPCAALAAESIDHATIKSLEVAHRLMIEAKQKKNMRDALKYNFQFHFNLYERSKSPFLVSLISDLWARTTGYVAFFHSTHVGGRSEASAAGPHVHSTIISALKAGDPSRVRTGIERDLLTIRDGALSKLETQNLHDNHNAVGVERPRYANKKEKIKNPLRKARA